MAAQKATGKRRQLAAVEADHAALRARQEELEHFLLAAPATDWGEAVAKARFLRSWRQKGHLPASPLSLLWIHVAGSWAVAASWVLEL